MYSEFKLCAQIGLNGITDNYRHLTHMHSCFVPNLLQRLKPSIEHSSESIIIKSLFSPRNIFQ